MRTLRALLLAAFLLCCAMLFGCADINAQCDAIEAALVAYSGEYIEVYDLGGQVRAQYPSVREDAVKEYSIVARIPDYSACDLAALGFSAPPIDWNEPSEAAYSLRAVNELHNALTSGAKEGAFDAFLETTLAIDVISDADGVCKASISSASKLNVKNAVADMIDALLSRDADMAQNRALLQIAQQKDALLKDTLQNDDFLALIRVANVDAEESGVYRMLLTYPEPNALYRAAADALVNSYTQPIFGELPPVSLADSLKGVDASAVQTTSGEALVCLAKNGAYALTDLSELTGALASAQKDAEADAQSRIEKRWLIQEAAVPKSGAILFGKSRGNRAVCKTLAGEHAYYYVCFYAISGDDASEEGALTLAVFIHAGKTATVYLPTGNYRMTYASGNDWYGTAYRFGPDGSYTRATSVQKSKFGFYNTFTFGVSEGNVGTENEGYSY